jgi:hypothetical protein
MNLAFIRVDYPRLKSRVLSLEENFTGGVPGGLSAVAYSGDYGDLINLPTLFSGDYNDLANLPILFSGDYNDLINQPVIPPANNTVTDHISEFELDGYIYSGFILNLSPIIRRYKNSIYEIAQGVTNLPTDWANRLALTYI